jgi:hypothetical protein
MPMIKADENIACKGYSPCSQWCFIPRIDADSMIRPKWDYSKMVIYILVNVCTYTRMVA